MAMPAEPTADLLVKASGMASISSDSTAQRLRLISSNTLHGMES